MANFTQKAIKDTFLKLLDERPLSQISVKMLVEECGINRNTFYYHYADIPALIEYAVDFIRKESYSEDAVLTVYQGLKIPEPLAKFGWDCKSILFKPADAIKVAEECGVQIISLNGGDKGVIGAVAAIGCFDMGEKAAGVPQDFE